MVAGNRLHWRPLPKGYLTLNVDNSVSLSRGVSGCGGVIRNDEGRWLLRFACRSQSMLVLSVEQHALLVGLRLAWIYGYTLVIVETDCLNIINCVSNSDDAVLPEFQESIAELRELLSRRWHVKLEHIQRSANTVADCLAKQGAGEQCDMRVFTSPPHELLHLLKHDLAPAV